MLVATHAFVTFLLGFLRGFAHSLFHVPSSVIIVGQGTVGTAVNWHGLSVLHDRTAPGTGFIVGRVHLTTLRAFPSDWRELMRAV